MDIKQDDILNLIRKQEADIEKLLKTKSKAETYQDYASIDMAISVKESIIRELRGLM